MIFFFILCVSVFACLSVYHLHEVPTEGVGTDIEVDNKWPFLLLLPLFCFLRQALII